MIYLFIYFARTKPSAQCSDLVLRILFLDATFSGKNFNPTTFEKKKLKVRESAEEMSLLRSFIPDHHGSGPFVLIFHNLRVGSHVSTRESLSVATEQKRVTFHAVWLGK